MSTLEANVNEQSTSLAPAGFIRQLSKQPVALISAIFLLLVIIASLAAPLLAPYPPNDLDLLNALSTPTSQHLLGTDELGRDVLSRLMYGGVPAITGVVVGVVTALVIAIPLGIVSGYRGGMTDRLVMGIIDASLAIPGIILVLVVLTLFPGNLIAAMITFGLLVSLGFARVIRGVTLPLNEAGYVAAARIAGVSDLKIMARHIFPGVLNVIIVQASFVAASTLLFAVGLGFLGLTANPGDPEWGRMVADAAQLINRQPWLLVPSGGLIALCILALVLFGTAIRDATAERRLTKVTATTPQSTSSHQDATPRPIGENVLLAVRDLTVGFSNGKGNTIVVDKVSFDIKPGEMLGCVGESGAGKTITGLAILRLLPNKARINGGQVIFEGQDLVKLSDHDFDKLRGSTLGLISQEPLTSLDPSFTVGSQLGELVGRHDGLRGPARTERCLELLRQVRIQRPEQILKSYPHEISGGMAQRVAIAMALAGRPQLLIADEPTTALDVTVQKEILTLLRQLQAETGMAVLLITHNLGVVADICDRVVVLYAGQVFEEADVYQLFDAPLNPYTWGLLKAMPSHARPGELLRVIPGRLPEPGAWPVGCRFATRCAYAAEECLAGAIPLLEPAAGRHSRCIRIKELVEDERSQREFA
jgi:peptide/nickel transport system permease protein